MVSICTRATSFSFILAIVGCSGPPAAGPDARTTDAAAFPADGALAIDAAPAIDAGDAGPMIDAGAMIDGGACVPTITGYPILAGMHVATGTVITTWNSNPPSSGAHYPQWGKWNGTYDAAAPMARGNYVHNLEHGGVILLYNCPGGCAADVAGLQAVMAAVPVEPACVAPITSRTFITADADLPPGVKIAATAWGFTYTADCFDPTSLHDFVVGHYALGPENTCADGQLPP